VAGEGAAKYPDTFPLPIEPLLPSAADLAELTVRRLAAAAGAAGSDPAADTGLLPPEPLYLRRPDAVEPGARKPVSQPALR
jgi:tRNA threonylcarbamoyladenosine biosynthesis protein TsaB